MHLYRPAPFLNSRPTVDMTRAATIIGNFHLAYRPIATRRRTALVRPVWALAALDRPNRLRYFEYSKVLVLENLKF
jgi:hypothetical protein